jgi:hypothetical protein
MQCAQGISLAHSKTLAGLWAIQMDVVKFWATDPGAPIFRADGNASTMLMAYKTATVIDGTMMRCVSALTVENWSAWLYDHSPLGAPNACIGADPHPEDPSNLWEHRRGNVHFLTHNNGWGGAAASPDFGRSWHFNISRLSYDYEVEFEDGSKLVCVKREEPKVLLGQDGQPTVLITVCRLPDQLPNTALCPSYPSGEPHYVTRVVMQPIGSKTDDGDGTAAATYTEQLHSAPSFASSRPPAPPPPIQPLLPLAMAPLRLGEIKPAGWLKQQLQIQAEGLSGHMGLFWRDIVDSVWVGGDFQEPYGLNEDLPYWLNGFIPLAFHLNDSHPHLMQQVNEIADKIIDSQDEDGWFGPRDQPSNNGGRYWRQYPLLLALTQYAEAAPPARSTSIVSAIRRYLKWQAKAIAPFAVHNFTALGHTCRSFNGGRWTTVGNTSLSLRAADARGGMDEAVLTDVELPSSPGVITVSVSITFPNRIVRAHQNYDQTPRTGVLIRACSAAQFIKGANGFSAFGVEISPLGFAKLVIHTGRTGGTVPGTVMSLVLAENTSIAIPTNQPVRLQVRMVTSANGSATFVASVDHAVVLRHSIGPEIPRVGAWAGIVNGTAVALRTYCQDATWSNLTLTSQLRLPSSVSAGAMLNLDSLTKLEIPASSPPEDGYRSQLDVGTPLGSWARYRWQELALVVYWMLDHHPGGDEVFLLTLARTIREQGFDWPRWYASKGTYQDCEAHGSPFSYNETVCSYIPPFPVAEVPRDMNFNSPTFNGIAFANHGVNNGQALKEGAVRFRATGDPGDNQSSYDRVQLLERYHGTAGGVMSCDEHLAGLHPSHGTELCTVVESMFSYAILFSVHGEPRFAEQAEKIAFNSLPAELSEDMWSHPYLKQPNEISTAPAAEHFWASDGPSSTVFNLEPNFPCCTGNFNQGYPKFVSNLAYVEQATGSIVLGMLAPCEIRTQRVGGGLTLQVNTSYPFADTIQITATSASAFKLAVRIPSWVTNATVTDSHRRTAAAIAGTLHRVACSAGRSTITVVLPARLRIERRFNAAASVHRGALLYSVDIAANITQLPYCTFQDDGGDKDQCVNTSWALQSHLRTDQHGMSLVADSPWAWQLELSDDSEPEHSLREVIGQVPGASAAPPFSRWGVPVLLEAHGRTLATWGTVRGSAAAPPPPASANISVPRQTFSMLPYGATHGLSMVELPTMTPLPTPSDPMLKLQVDCQQEVSDNATGVFASMSEARDSIRARRAAGRALGTVAVTVSGTCRLNSTFELEGRDADVIWTAATDTTIDGGWPLVSATKVTAPAIIALLAQSVRGRVLQASLGELDLGTMKNRPFTGGSACIRTDLYEESGMELYYDDRLSEHGAVRMQVARWPDRDFTQTRPTTDNWANISHSAPQGSPFQDPYAVSSMSVSWARGLAWAAEVAHGHDLHTHGLWCQKWADSHRSVISVLVPNQTRVVATRSVAAKPIIFTDCSNESAVQNASSWIYSAATQQLKLVPATPTQFPDCLSWPPDGPSPSAVQGWGPTLVALPCDVTSKFQKWSLNWALHYDPVNLSAALLCVQAFGGSPWVNVPAATWKCQKSTDEEFVQLKGSVPGSLRLKLNMAKGVCLSDLDAAVPPGPAPPPAPPPPTNQVTLIVSVDDRDNKDTTPAGGNNAGKFYVYNSLSELSEPGEYVVDRKAKMVYFVPPVQTNGSAVGFSVSAFQGPLIRVVNSSNVQFMGFRVRHGRGVGLRVIGSTGVVFSNGSIKDVGTIGVNITGGERCGVRNANISRVGDGGVMLQGGDRVTLTPASHFVVGGDVHDYNRWIYNYAPGILLDGVGNLAIRTTVRDAPQFGLYFSGNDHHFDQLDQPLQ